MEKTDRWRMRIAKNLMYVSDVDRRVVENDRIACSDMQWPMIKNAVDA